MTTQELISVEVFCMNNQIDTAFIYNLQQKGFIEIKTVDNIAFMPADTLAELEKIITLHFELDINMEGIETITYLLNQQQILQKEIAILKNRLRIYEDL